MHSIVISLHTTKLLVANLYSPLSIVSDVLHPNRANVSKDELREKLAELYKANKDQVSCFGFRTQYGGGKSTGFALIYDSHEALKKFEPHYRLVRYGVSTKVEKASRQQRMCSSFRSSPPPKVAILFSEANWGAPLQASNAKTERRLSEVRQRRKGLLRRRRNSWMWVCDVDLDRSWALWYDLVSR